MHILIILALATLEGVALSRAPAPVKRAPHVLLTAADRHVRALDPDMQFLLARGMARSATFSKLMTALDGTDVVVYVEFSTRLDASVAGRLLFAVAPPGGPRYLRVQIAPAGSINQQVAVVAHELQHALEVASAPHVRDEPGLASLYETIGASPGTNCYDTEAARLAGRRVLFELQS